MDLPCQTCGGRLLSAERPSRRVPRFFRYEDKPSREIDLNDPIPDLVRRGIF